MSSRRSWPYSLNLSQSKRRTIRQECVDYKNKTGQASGDLRFPAVMRPSVEPQKRRKKEHTVNKRSFVFKSF